MSVLSDIFKGFTTPGENLTKELFASTVTALVPGWGPVIAAAAMGISGAVSLIKRAVGGETITPEMLAAEWPAIQAEAIRVGAGWDASERKKPDSTV